MREDYEYTTTGRVIVSILVFLVTIPVVIAVPLGCIIFALNTVVSTVRPYSEVTETAIILDMDIEKEEPFCGNIYFQNDEGYTSVYYCYDKDLYKLLEHAEGTTYDITRYSNSVSNVEVN